MRAFRILRLAATFALAAISGDAVAWGASLSWSSHAAGRVASVAVSPSGRAGFTSLDPRATGLAFTNQLAIERSLTNHVLLNGSGVALGDVDGDGHGDVFLAGLGGGSALFRNLGNWKFANATSAALGSSNALKQMDATGAALADLDGDGDLDLLVNGIGSGTRCWRNDGRGSFQEVTAEVGLGGRSGASSLALADIDGDGDLDLYVVNYRTSTVRDEFQQRFEIKRVNGRPVIAAVNGRPTTEPDLLGRFSIDAEGRITEHGEADALYRNDGQGRFTLVPFTTGAFRDEAGQPLPSPPFDWGLAAMFRDLNGDGAPDLYVCNDLASPDRIWINDGAGNFRAITRAALRKTSWFSMGADFGDLNRDGYDDLFVTDMLSRDPVQRQVEAAARGADPDASLFSGSEARPQTPRNTLFLGRGDGTFAEAAWLAGLAASEWSWSPVLLDVDLDGYEDALISTGFERNVQDVDVAEAIEAIRQREKLSDAAALQLRKRFPSLALPNLAFRNQGDLTFVEMGKEWGFDRHGISQGMAVADLDNDGDLDVVLNNQGSPAALLRNDSDAPRLGVRLRGQSPNTQAIGARIQVTGGPVAQSQEVIAGGRYLSGDEPMRVFAAGSPAQRLDVAVVWRNGRRTEARGLAPNQIVEIVEPAIAETSSAEPNASKPDAPPPLFSNVSARLNHRHFDEPFDDFARQPLLPRRLSQLGPAVCWGDLNQDGADDLVVGSGRGGRIGVYLNDGKGGFAPDLAAVFQRPSPADQSGILIWPSAERRPELLVGFNSYEAQAGGGVRIYDLSARVMRLGGPNLPAAIGPLASADLDGDGQLELFVGGRVIPGRYPQPADSALFRRRNGDWSRDEENSAPLARVGLVTAATFSDLDGDGDVDLIIATEWGPLRAFRNEGGKLAPWDWPVRGEGDAVGANRLSELLGWWNGVASVDLDNDGRLDLVAANWGRNTQYQAARGREGRLYFGDFATNGVVHFLETQVDAYAKREIPLRTRGALGQAWPTILERYPTRRSFGEAEAPQILGQPADYVAVNALDSVVLLNRGDHFLVRPLPVEAQLAPAFGVVAADFNGDGNEDVFLSQNFFGVHPETDRHDGGLGLLMLGDGRGNLRPLSPRESGLRLPGEQRGAAAADFDRDGRADLVVTQNSEPTQLFRNETSQPGLRVRLRGPSGNPTSIGAQLRLLYGNSAAGPVRELTSGSGFWSQNSPVVVLGRANTPEAIWIRWPGKEPTVVSLNRDDREIELRQPENESP